MIHATQDGTWRVILYDCYFCRYSPLAGDLLAGNAILPGAGSQPSVNGSGWCLFVYNLAPETEENILWQLFGPFGAVQNVKVIRDLQVIDRAEKTRDCL